MLKLVVVNPFEGYSRGDEITDAALVEEILNGENEPNVRRVNIVATEEG